MTANVVLDADTVTHNMVTRLSTCSCSLPQEPSTIWTPVVQRAKKLSFLSYTP
ncbi:hypothetical protein SCLCIDRAFT_271703 [Scleroderma citrinum Foug A]|uniref:Uncharacterized protein n=1 Tax=Scleroderma citrinum Foug A TaxID=1036808 RepID=A0A0C2Z2C1_9AGAM|nr:hypothetical protein SCLCIDRAFT_271703 [Scleroderma citrinum Foug A]